MRQFILRQKVSGYTFLDYHGPARMCPFLVSEVMSTENIEGKKIEYIIEAALFTADEPLSAEKLANLFEEGNRPSLGEVRAALASLQMNYAERGVELLEVASGYRFQAKAECAEFIKRMWEKKPPRYSRALMETLALIAYRQPITRGEIEDVRGVTVSSQTMKTLMEREWVKIAGHRDVPGKPALYATTRGFLDYFNLKNLSDLPALAELVDFESLEKQLGLQLPPSQQASTDADSSVVDEQVVASSDTASEITTDTDEIVKVAVDDAEEVSSDADDALADAVSESESVTEIMTDTDVDLAQDAEIKSPKTAESEYDEVAVEATV